MVKLTVGEKIKQLRKEKGLTQCELGDLLGVKKAAVQKYESGQVQNLKQVTIKKLCTVFDKSPSYFIFDNEYETQLRNEFKLIEMIEEQYGRNVLLVLEIIVELDDEYLEKVISYASDLQLLQSVRKA